MAERGKFITVEGVDGAGKSSHLPHIESLIRAGGHDVLVTREPGGTPLAEKLRALVLTDAMDATVETLLMFAARADHVRAVIMPALARGAWVLCDRFTDATLAYQGGGKGVPGELIEHLARTTHPDLRPDRTLIFDCPYDIAVKRLRGTGKALDRFEREGQAFFERVRQAYLRGARADAGRLRVIDASQPIETVKMEIARQLAFD